MQPAFLTHSLPGTGGSLRERLEDFRVEEELVRSPRGRGRFLWLEVEKRGISTPELLRRLGALAGSPAHTLGVAGYKDARAVARQWVSLPAKAGRQATRGHVEDVELLEAVRDEEALVPRKLARNRFTVVVRGLPDVEQALARARAVLEVLLARGTPNFYGPQRFGVRGESAEVGRLLLLERPVAALGLILGAPSEAEADPRAHAFREAFERGLVGDALRLVPGALRVERRLLERLHAGASPDQALRALPRGQARFYLSAWQSLLFNRVLARRLETLDVPLRGDLLLHRGQRSGRACDDPEADRERVLGFELSPSGPLFGTREPLADGEPGRIERDVLAASGVAGNHLRGLTGLPLHGERRSLRYRAEELEARALADEGALELRFALPPGSFATALLGEVTRDAGPPL